MDKLNIPFDVVYYMNEFLPIAIESDEAFDEAINAWFGNEDEKNWCRNRYGDINLWKTHKVKNMSRAFAFRDCTEINVERWDVSACLDMHLMFYDTTNFNSDLSKWDVSACLDMHSMFYGATSFNSDISKWDVSQCLDMNWMFANAKSFNSDLSEWDVSNVKNMYGMFVDATSFNSDLSKWDVSRCSNMSRMFWNATNFNSDLSKWDVSQCLNMLLMFCGASSFNSDIFQWNISTNCYKYGMLDEMTILKIYYKKFKTYLFKKSFETKLFL